MAPGVSPARALVAAAVLVLVGFSTAAALIPARWVCPDGFEREEVSGAPVDDGSGSPRVLCIRYGVIPGGPEPPWPAEEIPEEERLSAMPAAPDDRVPWKAGIAGAGIAVAGVLLWMSRPSRRGHPPGVPGGG